MINLHYPPADQPVYLLWLAPTEVDTINIGSIGSSSDPQYLLPLAVSGESFHQGGGLFGEKGVTQEKTAGTIYYVPANASVVFSPTSTLLYREKITGICNGVLKTQYAGFGSLSRSSGHRVRKYSAGVKKAMHIADYSSPGSLDLFVLESAIYSDLRYTIRRFSSPVVLANDVLSCEVSTWTETLSTTKWRDEQSLSTIAAAIASAGAPATVVRQKVTVSVFRATSVHSPQMLRSYIQSALFEPELALLPNPAHRSWGDLAKDATDQVHHTDVNLIESFLDLAGGETLLKMLRNFKKLRFIKKTADAYLTVNYGVLPTIDDIATLLKDWKKFRHRYYDKNGFQTYHSGETLASTGSRWTRESIRRVKVAISVNDNWFERLVQSAEEIGVMPDLQAIWEIIPFSFVVDWVVDIGDWLDRVDSRSRIYRLNIRYVTMSQKHVLSRTFDGSELSLFGIAQRVGYHRWTSDQCPLPPLSLGANPSDQSHWLESGALVIQHTL